jgi:hypothetical protein
MAELACRVAAIGLLVATACVGARTMPAEAGVLVPRAAPLPPSCSGPDPYDPAAGCHPEASVPASAPTYSGDDGYDPGAGGATAQTASSASGGSGSQLRCGLSMDKLFRRLRARIPGGYSGDDPYDPAAGGTPEMSLIPYCAGISH